MISGNDSQDPSELWLNNSNVLHSLHFLILGISFKIMDAYPDFSANWFFDLKNLVFEFILLHLLIRAELLFFFFFFFWVQNFEEEIAILRKKKVELHEETKVLSTTHSLSYNNTNFVQFLEMKNSIIFVCCRKFLGDGLDSSSVDELQQIGGQLEKSLSIIRSRKLRVAIGISKMIWSECRIWWSKSNVQFSCGANYFGSAFISSKKR